MAGEILEQLSHLEILVRHAIDAQLRDHVDEARTGIPWFLIPPFLVQENAIDAVRDRLRRQKKETRDQIMAGLSFGFRSGWLGKNYEELWRQRLHKDFPFGTGQRKEASTLAEGVRKFRNRIAHHDSLLNVDVAFEMKNVFRLAEIIDPSFARWMKLIDRTRKVGQQKPETTIDTVIVPTAQAWDLYRHGVHAYVCQPGRFFQDISHVAFYSNRAIQVEVPHVKRRINNVKWAIREAEILSESKDRQDRQLGKVMKAAFECGWTGGRYHVFMLTAPTDPRHVTLARPLVNDKSGRGSAFVRKQRYTSTHQLQHAESIWNL